jgi:hypothetical protein
MPHVLSFVFIALIGLLSTALEPIYAAVVTEEDVVETETAADRETASQLTPECPADALLETAESGQAF